MWCPSVSLSVWANAWLAGLAAPDDVLDALSQWAPKHSVTAYDSLAAGATGLPWPDLVDTGAVSLLQTLRTAAGPGATAPPIGLALPVPGDVRGLPAGTQFQRDAVTAGEALVVSGAGSIGLVPDFEYDELATDDDFDPGPCGLSWTVYSVPDVAIPPAHVDLGEAEYGLRSAVRSAADALGALRAGAADVDVADPRGLVEQALESTRVHRLPDHAPNRALRVLENAAHVDAIISVSSELIPIGLHSSTEVQIASEALRPLSTVVRSARLAAVESILHSAWRG
ncbi:hypothetical protein DQP55_06385 [Mycolicibacterium sp. GF69]|uniref:hypothetical protein n=1 Tax=Mycolicibacterium sp. GF69 TaxID=2267251 RepID=UPI000DCCF87E|nr:hypothetical protein [Mycolicibacterium sp. GF69]RAV15772.1 hypothetical protein DQP55_06385 [Mycolicibacterium sp. GF69]